MENGVMVFSSADSTGFEEKGGGVMGNVAGGLTARGEIYRVFSYQGRKVRVVIRDGEPWMVAKDVCEVLKHSNYRKAVKDMVDDEDVTKGYIPHPQNPEKIMEVICVNESGLYSLIFRSYLPEARLFRRWVTHEVLPAIRRTGGYGSTPESREAYEELAGMLMNQERMLGMLMEQSRLLQRRLEEMHPAGCGWGALLAADRELVEEVSLEARLARQVNERRRVFKLERLGAAQVTMRLLAQGLTYKEVTDKLLEMGHRVGKSSVARFAASRRSGRPGLGV